MVKISNQIQRLYDDSTKFKTDQESWLGKSGTDVKENCDNPVISTLQSAETLTKNMESIIDSVNELNSEINAVSQIDNSISEYNSKIAEFYRLSIIKRTMLIGTYQYYHQQLYSLNKKRNEHIEIIKAKESSINSMVSKII